MIIDGGEWFSIQTNDLLIKQSMYKVAVRSTWSTCRCKAPLIHW